MPQKEIPCKDCDKEKTNIELTGDQEVTSCSPIPTKPGWCLIIWRRKERSS